MDKIDIGEFECECKVLRAGRGVTVAEAQLHQGATHAATVLATFGVSRSSSVQIEAEARPHRPAPHELPVIPYLEGIMPPCQQHFDSRFTDGSFPFSGHDATETAGWIRLHDPGDHAEAAVSAMLDSFPFPFMQQMRVPAPVTSIMMTAHFLHVENADLSDWWWLRSQTLHAANGYATFATRLYRPDGYLGAWAEQLVGVYDKPAQ